MKKSMHVCYFDRDPIYTRLADKISVREYVKRKDRRKISGQKSLILIAIQMKSNLIHYLTVFRIKNVIMTVAVLLFALINLNLI